MSKRPVIVHFHLFKNAGTSVDKILKNNFADRWVEIEGPNRRKLDTEALVSFIRANPQYDVISSHTAVISVPQLDDINIIPIVFMRHPIDRIRSAYDFERKQDAQTPGAIKAKEGDFNHYMTWRLSTPAPWQISDFHASRFKDFHTFTPAKQREKFLPNSLATIEALPLIGRVEEFDTSMVEYEKLITPHFPNFRTEKVHENATTAQGLNLTQKLEVFKERIGADVYKQLLDLNANDMKLYEHVKSCFHARLNHA